MKKFIGEGALLFTTLIWGGTFVIVKSSLDDSSPVLFVAIRFAIAAVLIALIMRSKILNISKRTLKAGIILGVLLFLGFTLQTIGLKYTSATKSAFITGSIIMFTPVVQAFYTKKFPPAGSIIGILLALMGLIFLASKGTDILNIFAEFGSGFNLGDFLTLACAFAWSFYLVYLNVESSKNDYMELTFLQISTTTFVAFAVALAFHFYNVEPAKLVLTGNLFFGLAYTSLLATFFTTILHTKYQKFVSPTKTSIIFSFEPIFAAIFAYIALHETISAFGLIGGACIFSGLLVSELYDNISKKGKEENAAVTES